VTSSPLDQTYAFAIGPFAIGRAVVTTWGIVALLGIASFLMTRKLAIRPGKGQAVLELLVGAIDNEIRANIPGDPGRYRALVGTLLLFILTANWSSLIPGIEPPTARLETDAALATIVFVATIAYGVKAQGPLGYLASFARPSWVMIPLNLVEQVTRAFALMMRLFGNVMSGVFVVGIVLSLAGLLVPIPLMALDLLTGAVQAYIFSILAIVFIASAVEQAPLQEKEDRS
jgi:F-type H+-transporting ATPase subunit a